MKITGLVSKVFNEVKKNSIYRVVSIKTNTFASSKPKGSGESGV